VVWQLIWEYNLKLPQQSLDIFWQTQHACAAIHLNEAVKWTTTPRIVSLPALWQAARNCIPEITIDVPGSGSGGGSACAGTSTGLLESLQAQPSRNAASPL